MKSCCGLALWVAFVSMFSACGTVDNALVKTPVGAGRSIVPDVPIPVTPRYTSSLASVVEFGVAGAILNYVYQPLDATWDIADIPLAHDTHRLSLRMKRFTTGGEGEAWQTAKRYAERLQAAKGASGFVILEFTSGIDSSTPFARRVSESVVRFNDVPPDPVMLPPMVRR
jgi:hypothetical protein